MEDERNILSFSGEFLVAESDCLVADGGLLVTESDSRAGQRNNKKEGIVLLERRITKHKKNASGKIMLARVYLLLEIV